MSYLSQVVKVVLVSDPLIVGLQAVWLIGDVPDILSLTNEEFSLEKLRRKHTHTYIWTTTKTLLSLYGL